MAPLEVCYNSLKSFVLLSIGPQQAQSPTETTSCRPLNQRPQGGSKHICSGSADTWTSSHPDSNSTTTAPCHTTAKQVSPTVILLTKITYLWMTTNCIFWYIEDLFPDYHNPFMITDIWTPQHWVNFTSIWTHLFALWKLCWTKWPPLQKLHGGSHREEGWPDTLVLRLLRKGVWLSSLRYCRTI